MPAPSAPRGDVADRLEKLASHAPTEGVDPDVVWKRGTRRHRRRVGAVLAGVAAVGLLGVSVAPALVERSQGIDPAEPGTSMVLPDVIREPGGWESSFGDAPGRLSAVGLGEKSSLRDLSSRPAWWGVSAATGQPGFLELPGLAAAAGEPALSADGRLLAYWMTGPVSGRPIPMGSTTGRAEDAAAVVGVAVMDLETGKRDVWEIDSEHGLFIGGMAWASDELWWWAGPVRSVNGTLGGESLPHRWNVRTGARDASVEDAGAPVGFAVSGAAPGGFLQQDAQWGLRWTTATRATNIRLVVPSQLEAGASGLLDPVMSPDGSRVAVLLRRGSSSDDVPGTVLVGEVVEGVARLRPLDGAEANGLTGWRSATEVVLTDAGDASVGAPRTAQRAWTIDVLSGDQSDLLTLSGNNPVVAADAWTATVVSAPAPPFAPDPRQVAVVVVCVLLLGVWGWRIVRSRRAHP